MKTEQFKVAGELTSGQSREGAELEGAAPRQLLGCRGEACLGVGPSSAQLLFVPYWILTNMPTSEGEHWSRFSLSCLSVS